MKILITGANGFLGSHLLEVLYKTHKIYAISKNSNNISHLLDSVKFDSVIMSEIHTLEKKIDHFAPDIVLHFAWEGGNAFNATNNLNQFENLKSSIDFINLFKNKPYKPKFIGIGSFAEYGNKKIKIKESSVTIPKNLYGFTKLGFKNYSEEFCKQMQMDWVWIRPCYIYGPKDVESRIIPKIIKKILIGESVILDECKSSVDYLYISDFVILLHSVIEKNATGVFNLCSGHKYEIKKIISIICKNLNVNVDEKIKFDSSLNRKNAPTTIWGDPSKVKKITDHKVFVNIEEGINKTIDFFVKNL